MSGLAADEAKRRKYSEDRSRLVDIYRSHETPRKSGILISSEHLNTTIHCTEGGGSVRMKTEAMNILDLPVYVCDCPSVEIAYAVAAKYREALGVGPDGLYNGGPEWFVADYLSVAVLGALPMYGKWGWVYAAGMVALGVVVSGV